MPPLTASLLQRHLQILGVLPLYKEVIVYPPRTVLQGIIQLYQTSQVKPIVSSAQYVLLLRLPPRRVQLHKILSVQGQGLQPPLPPNHPARPALRLTTAQLTSHPPSPAQLGPLPQPQDSPCVQPAPQVDIAWGPTPPPPRTVL